VTVESTLDRQYFDGNGLNKTFPFDFFFFQNPQIYVFLISPEGPDGYLGAVTGLTETIDYTLTGARNPSGGKVVLNNAPLPGQRVLVQRILPQIQPTSFRNQGAFLPQIHEDSFDRLTMLVQQSLSDLGNTIRTDRTGLRWDFQGKRGINAADPVNNTDVATKGWIGKYIDTISGLVNTTLGIAYDAGNLFDYFRLGVSRSVDNIAALRGLATTRNQRAFVFGYYERGDGGGGAYSLDPLDTTSADNGGTVIVSNDGGRWKLSQLGKISARQFGAKGDGLNADSVPIQKAVDTGRLVHCPAGRYNFIAPVTTIQGGGIEGDGEKTQFVRNFTGGQMIRHPGGNQLGSSIILRDFCITKAPSITVAPGDTGIDIGYAEAWGGRGDIANILIIYQWDGFKWSGGTMNPISNVQCLEGKGHGFLGINARGELIVCLAQYNAGNGYFFFAKDQNETGVQLTSTGTFGNQGWGYLFDAAAGVIGANIYMKGVSSSTDGLGGIGYVKEYRQIWMTQILIESAGDAYVPYPSFVKHDDAPGLYMISGCKQIVGSNIFIQNCRGAGAYFDSVSRAAFSNFISIENGKGGLGGNNAVGVSFGANNLDLKITNLIADFGVTQTTDISFGANNQVTLESPTFRTYSGGGNGVRVTGAYTSATKSLSSANPLNIPFYGDLFLVSGTTGFNTIPASYDGRRITLRFDANLTVFNDGNIKLLSNASVGPGSTLSLICDGINWYRTSTN